MSFFKGQTEIGEGTATEGGIKCRLPQEVGSTESKPHMTTPLKVVETRMAAKLKEDKSNLGPFRYPHLLAVALPSSQGSDPRGC